VIDELHKGGLSPLRLMRRKKESECSLTPRPDRSQGKMQKKMCHNKGKERAPSVQARPRITAESFSLLSCSSPSAQITFAALHFRTSPACIFLAV